MILIPIGTKAQLIKMAPVIKAFEKEEIPFHFVLTGQHQETMEDLITMFDLPKPDYQLVELEEASTKIKLSKWLIKILARHLKSSSPIASNSYKACIVHGDTMSTLVCALLARRHQIEVIHLEAGLRSFNYFHPFPEELIRVLVTRFSSMYCSAGKWATENLYKAGKNKNVFDLKENTLLDSVRFAVKENSIKLPLELPSEYCIASIHRYENLSDRSRFEFIINNLISISKDIEVLFVLHPATKAILKERSYYAKLSEAKINMVNRMDYTSFVKLISKSRFVISDGGSNQEECSYLNIPCLLMREATERQEGLDSNVVLSKYSQDVINQFLKKYITKHIEAKEHVIVNDSSINPSADLSTLIKKRYYE